jgi:large subunit ribosomal protein L9
MQVILLKDVDKVGLRGEVVDVARGYARNYLLPRQLAEPASSGRLEELRRREEMRARQEARTHDEAREIASRLEQAVLRFDVKAGPTGTLFGSVTATDVADRLWEQHRVRVDRRKIELEPLKVVGRREVPVEIFTDVTTTLRLEVVPEGGDIAQMEALQAAAEAEAAAAEAEAAAVAEAAAAAEAEAIEIVEAQEAAEAAEAAEATEAEGAAEASAEAGEQASDETPEAPAEEPKPSETEPEQ